MKLIGLFIVVIVTALGAVGGWGLFTPDGREQFETLGSVVPAAMVFASPFLMLVGLAMMFLRLSDEETVGE